MLYPKNKEPFSKELFNNPTCEYRATPFWAWNNKLDSDELCWQIEQLKKMGFGGFHMHVRTGLATKYLSDEHMSMVGACVNKAKDEQMLAWLYDEDRWPSGAAGGYVTKNPEYRACHLLLTRHPYTPETQNTPRFVSPSKPGRTDNGELLACFDVVLSEDKRIKEYKIIDIDDEAVGIKLYAYIETALPNPWYNNQTYVDTLNPDAIDCFINVTYDRYAEFFKQDFGGIVPAIFTDEPQFTHKMTLMFADEDKDITLPWTKDFAKTFKDIHNTDIVKALPELIFELPKNEISRVRYLYHDHIAERFAASFADRCGKWCEDNNLMLTGHMMEEPTLFTQTHALGEAMRSYRGFGLPGIDMLCDYREYTTAKQAQSAARQYGRPGVLSELYGVTNWNFDFRGHKLQGDWQAALGVTVRVPHLSWVSMNGEAKRDYPASFNYQSPWYTQYSYVEDHFARIASVMTRGTPICKVGVVHPIESYWLHWGSNELTGSIRNQMDRQFEELCNCLLRGLVDFDYICESLLPSQCAISDIDGGVFPVGNMKYDVILVPCVEMLRATTVERLKKFLECGGNLIFLGDAPKYCDGQLSDEPIKLYDRAKHINFDKQDILSVLSEYKDLDIRNENGDCTDNLLYQYRQDDENRWLFLAHADGELMPDISIKQNITITLCGEWSVEEYDTLNGNIKRICVSYENGNTVFRKDIFNHDSLLYRLHERGDTSTVSDFNEEVSQSDFAKTEYFSDEVPITLHEPNVLVMDMFEFALDDQELRPREEILRLDNILRGELGWAQREEAFPQPWVENDNSTPHTVHLKYVFHSDIEINSCHLALENADRSTVALNGLFATKTNDFYADKCIKIVSLPTIKKGENELKISMPFGKKTDLETCYLLGDFSVKLHGSKAELSSPVKTLSFGDITAQGLPFYGGNITYHLKATCTEGRMKISASNYRGHLLEVSVDGKQRGKIVFAPYEIILTDLSDGEHEVNVTLYGNRINTFGQLHCVDKTMEWWGPDSWRTVGENWTYGYSLWAQGIMKSPETTTYSRST